MLSSRLHNYITVDLINKKPEAQQMADSISQIMIDSELLPTQDNFLNKIVPECIAIAAELDKDQEKDAFSIGLDNQIKLLLKASLKHFPLTIEAAERPDETPVEEKKDDEEPDNGPTAADPAAGAKPSGLGPINFYINYDRYPDLAERQRKIDEFAAAAKIRREEERKPREFRLQQEYIRYLIEHIRKNLSYRKSLEAEIVQLGDRIKQQYDAWEKAWFSHITLGTPVNIPDQLKIDDAAHDKKIGEYRDFIYSLYSYSECNSAYFERHDSLMILHFKDLWDFKRKIKDRVAHEAKVKEAEQNLYGQAAMDIRLEAIKAAGFLGDEDRKRELQRQQKELQKLQQQQLEEQQQASTPSYRQI